MKTTEPTITEYISPIEQGKVRDTCAPYLQEIGLVIVSWNELHVELSQLFCTVAGFSDMLPGLNIWHSTENDRAQRKMIRSALSGGLSHLPRIREEGTVFLDRAKMDIEFLLNEADKISEDRNNVVHSPFLFAINDGNISMQSFDFFQSPRAIKLKGKDLLKILKQQREWTLSLSKFSKKIRLGLYLVPNPGWPTRPLKSDANALCS